MKPEFEEVARELADGKHENLKGVRLARVDATKYDCFQQSLVLNPFTAPCPSTLALPFSFPLSSPPLSIYTRLNSNPPRVPFNAL